MSHLFNDLQPRADEDRKQDPSAAIERDLRALYPDLDTWDEDEEDRLEHVALMKTRGKGAPKKKRSADESKKILGKRKKKAPTQTP
ncbi:MAG: hypothetical protein Q9180_008419 [Flavoplaca navasiana]